MENEKAKFDSLVDLIKESNEKNSKIKDKINSQIEEINKIKAIINQHEECLKQQNEILNKLLDEKLAIKNYKNDLVNELSKIGSSDDEEFEININNNYNKNFRFDSINYVNTNTKNYGYKNNLDNRRQIDMKTIINMNKPMNDNLKQFPDNISQHLANWNILSDCNDEPIKSFLESYIINDNFIPSQDKEISKRKVLIFSEYLDAPENDNSIFNDEDFIKKYSPKLLLKLQNETVLDMDICIEKSLNVCCAKGILLIYDKTTNLWSKFYTGNSKNISQYTVSKNCQYLICENEFVISDELKTKVKVFDSNIISKLLKSRGRNKYCCISLENGEIWRYDWKKDRYYKLFSLRSKMKACVNLPYNSSLFLTENKKVFTVLNRQSTRIPELDGCVDIIESRGPISVCYFGNGICKIYDMTNKTIFELEISESIKLAKHSQSILSLLDVQNRLHLYKFTKKTFSYEEIQVIQIPTSRNISAMSDVFNKQIFITVENEIYSIEYN